VGFLCAWINYINAYYVQYFDRACISNVLKYLSKAKSIFIRN